MAKTKALNPMTAQDLQLARDIIASSNLLIKYWQSCTRCTMDVKPLIDQANAHLQLAQGVLREFGGGDDAE